MILEERLKEYSKKYSCDKKIIYILKGIPSELYPKHNKLFSLAINSKICEIEAFTPNRLIELLGKINTNESWFWGTYEELNDFIPTIESNFRIVLVDNNLYNNYYPYRNNIENIDQIFTIIENDDEKELTSEEENLINTINKYYGSINKNIVDGSYFVSYAALKNINDQFDTLDLYENISVPIETINNHDLKENEFEFEIGFEEDGFLNLTSSLLNNDFNYNSVRIISTDNIDELPNNYLDRINILNGLVGNKIKIYFSPKDTTSEKIEFLNEYKKLLKENWNYDEFKNLKMYKNIGIHSKELIEVSQAQIINNIVQQSENALLGKNPRDIYITSSTGSGKSLMFQLPAIYLAKKHKDINPLTIVISPLIGLMNDQVESLENKNIKTARTIHSNMTIHDKEKVIEEIQNGKINLIYMSTETLQNNSDITMLIGDRKIGLFVVDEAHIVTTWGKSFRADYWYMGVYLQKLRKKHIFPIVTFTATAIYGGVEDMYEETRDSLNMVNPIKYFGYVKRDNIFMHIDNSMESYNRANNDYRTAKMTILMHRLEIFYQGNQKTLVYFPTIQLLNEFYNYLKKNSPKLFESTTRYYGPLEKGEKESAYKDFKSGKKNIILATKAFGMGIDIPDIINVYHFAPTGNVIDYIQEIGRAARNINCGRAFFDYLKPDFTYINKMYGMNMIKKSQIIEVMRKIKEQYSEKKSRHLTVSADDFQYILQNSEEDNIDNKIKIILLMIEKDFIRKLGFSPFYARPKQLFGNELIFMNSEVMKVFTDSNLSRYLFKVEDLNNNGNGYTSVYNFKIKDLWENEYKKYSFAQFKYFVFTRSNEIHLKHKEAIKKITFATGVSLNNSLNINQISAEFHNYLNVFEEFLRKYAITEKYFDESELANYVNKNLKLNNFNKAQTISKAFINTVLQFQGDKQTILKKREGKSNDSFTPQTNYIIFFEEIINYYDSIFFHKHNIGANFKKEYHFYRRRIFKGSSNSGKLSRFEKELLVLGLLESTGLLTYEIIGGNNPQIYIRVNTTWPIEKALNNPDKYNNTFLDDVHKKHKISVEMLNFLFTLSKHGNTKNEKIINYTKEFWNYIENYFLGDIPDEVYNALYKR